MAVYNETVLSFGNVGGNIPNLHLVRAALSGGITFGMSDKRGTVRDCYSETVAGEALFKFSTSNKSLARLDICILSPLARVRSLLSSNTVFKFSIHIASTGPSKMIHDT